MLMIAMAVAAAQAPLTASWAQFGRSGALNRMSETVDIGTGDKGETGQFQYELRLTKEVSGKAIEVRRADSISCPAIRSVIESMPSIAMPVPAPYGVPGRSRTMILDGMSYFLTTPSSDIMGKMSLSSNIGSPLALWIDASLKQLAPCWLPIAP